MNKLTQIALAGAHALIATIVFEASAAAHDALPKYELIDLGIPDVNRPFAINDRGQIVGTLITPPRGYVWERGHFHVVNDAGEASSATDINDRGQIVGSYLLDGTGVGYLQDDGFNEDLPFQAAVGINNRRQVTGWSNADNCTPANFPNCMGKLVGYLYDRGSLTTIPGIGGETVVPAGLNDRGEVVGSANLSPGTFGPYHAFLYRNGRTIDLGTLGGLTSGASDINSQGHIVGASDFTDGQQHAFLYRNGRMIDLGTVGSDISSTAFALNDEGVIVGASQSVDFVGRAMIYSRGQMRYLKDLVDPAHPVPPSVALWYGTSINDNGWIAVVGADSSKGFDEMHNYLMRPVRRRH